MNRIEKLIEEMCPEGVPNRRLNEIASVVKGEQVNRQLLSESNPFPVYNGGTGPSGNHIYSNFPADTITVSQGGASAGFVNFVSEPLWVGAHCFAVAPSTEVDNRFLYFALKSKQRFLQGAKYGAGIPALDKKTLNNLQILIPPLEIQKEIVNILDKFTQLEAELEAELEARSKQIIWMRNNLLEGRAEPNNRTTLSDLISVKMCKRIFKSETSSNGDIPFFKIGTFGSDPDSFISRALFESYKDMYPYPQEGQILMSCSGTLGKVIKFDGKDSYFQDSNIVWLSNDEKAVLNGYLYHFLKNHKWSLPKGTIGRIYSKDILRIEIDLPSIELQRKIVRALDSATTLEESIHQGLPAEIAARRKQYEYYREKLLTFKELDAA